MHKKVIFIVRVFLVLFGCKSRKAVVVQEALEFWGHLRNQYIKPKVEFPFVDEIRKALILLNHVTGVSRNILNFLGQKDALSLARIDGLNNKSHRLLLFLHKIHEFI